MQPVTVTVMALSAPPVMRRVSASAGKISMEPDVTSVKRVSTTFQLARDATVTQLESLKPSRGAVLCRLVSFVSARTAWKEGYATSVSHCSGICSLIILKVAKVSSTSELQGHSSFIRVFIIVRFFYFASRLSVQYPWCYWKYWGV